MMPGQNLFERTRRWVSADEPGVDPRHVRRRRRFRVIGIGVLIPTVLALFYYALVARPQYSTEMLFTVQGLEPQQPDLLSGIGLPAITRPSNDGLVVVEFIQSQAMVSSLAEDYGFDAAYSDPSLDPWARIPATESLEDKTDFWLDRVTAAHDPVSNLVSVEVRAYTPEDSLRIAEGVLRESEEVVNALNERVQNEAVRVAEAEVEGRREDYEQARRRVVASRANRASTLETDTAQQATLISNLEGQLANARIERAGMIAQFRPSSPQIQAIDERIAALEAELEDARGGRGVPETSRDVSAQTALLDYEFAQQAYYRAIEARRQAITNREHERRYLISVVPPRLPEESDYWGRFANVLAIALGAALIMSIAALSYSVIKDHLE